MLNANSIFSPPHYHPKPINNKKHLLSPWENVQWSDCCTQTYTKLWRHHLNNRKRTPVSTVGCAWCHTPPSQKFCLQIIKFAISIGIILIFNILRNQELVCCGVTESSLICYIYSWNLFLFFNRWNHAHFCRQNLGPTPSKKNSWEKDTILWALSLCSTSYTC